MEDEPQPEEEPLRAIITELNDEIREMVSRNHFSGILPYAQSILCYDGKIYRNTLEALSLKGLSGA